MQKYITLTNHTYEAFTWTANTEWFNGLSADTQELIRTCAEQACKDANKQIVASMDQIRTTWEGNGFNEIYELSPEEVDVFKTAVADVTKEYAELYGEEACAAFGITVS